MDSMSSRFEERLVELHSVIAELSRQVEERSKDKILEEEDDNVEDDDDDEADDARDQYYKTFLQLLTGQIMLPLWLVVRAIILT